MHVGPLATGELILLRDRAGRAYPVRLQAGAVSSLHSGTVRHDELLGGPEGSVVTTSRGSRLLALRPTFAEQVVSRARRAQPIYPKDLGAVLLEADIYPGARVLEGGTGAGALALALSRAVGPEGRVLSYEIRPEFHAEAGRAITEIAGGLPANLELRLGDISEAAGEFDRVCLDLPQPWEVLDQVAARLRPGGVLFAHCPNLNQVQRLAESMRARQGFGLLATKEVLERGWTVRDRSLRPQHRMVAHSGFLFFARRLGEGLLFETEGEGFR